MATPVRDPKMDPRPGDVVSKLVRDKHVQRTVINRRPKEVDYRSQPGSEGTVKLHTWQPWCYDAKVIKTA